MDQRHNDIITWNQESSRRQNMTDKASNCHICSNNLATRRGRHLQMAKIVCISLLPIIMLVIQNIVTVADNFGELDRRKAIQNGAKVSIQIGQIIHDQQVERGTTVMFVASNGDSDIHTLLREKYRNTDAAISAMADTWPGIARPVYFASKDLYHTRIKNFRAGLAPDSITMWDVIEFYTNDIAVLIDWIARGFTFAPSGPVWQILAAYHMLILSQEQAGLERAVGSTFYTRGEYHRPSLMVLQNPPKLERPVGSTFYTRGEYHRPSLMVLQNPPKLERPVGSTFYTRGQKL